MNNPLHCHLSAAYSDDMGMKGMLINNRLEFYDCISYDVLDDKEAKERVTLQVGNVIDMEEEEEEEAFAVIRAIFCHEANNANRYVFLVIDWFQATGDKDELLECPYYKLHDPGATQWRRIYPISFVDHASRTHFIHHCTRHCTNEHDKNNQLYLRNDFFYKTV